MDTNQTISEETRVFCAACDAEDEGNFKKAIKLYKRAGRMGSTSALTNLGNLYAHTLTPAQPEKAVYYYKRAVSANDSEGAWNLTIHYKLKGDQRYFNFWLRKAAQMKNELATEILGKNEEHLLFEKPWSEVCGRWAD